MFKTYKKFIAALSHDLRLQFHVVILLILAQATLETLSVSLMFPLMQSVLGLTLNSKFDFIAPLLSFDSKNIFIYLFLIVFIFKNIYTIFTNYKVLNFISLLHKFINQSIFIRQLHLKHNKFKSSNSSIYIRDITTESNNFINFSISPFFTLITESVVIFFIISYLFFLNLKMTFFLILIFIITLYLYYHLTRSILNNAGKENQDISGKVIKLANEAYLSHKEISLYNSQNYFIKKLDLLLKFLQKSFFINSFYGTLPRIILETIFISLFIFSLILNTSGDYFYSLALLGTYGFAAFRILPSLSKLLTSTSSLKFGQSSFQNILCQLSTNIEYPSNSIYPPEYSTPLISFNNISFKYNDSYILRNINFSACNNDFIGITGASGSGKSTLLNLLLGFEYPSSGTITFNGFNIIDIIQSWHSWLAYVPQNVYLLDEDIYKNIAFGANTIDIEKIDKLIHSLNLESVLSISNVRENLGESGSNVSGGQIQRIGIARALYRNPRILILDEVTSSLDSSTEILTMQLLKNINLDCIVFMVTHKIDTLKFCNKVLNLKNGTAQFL